MSAEPKDLKIPYIKREKWLLITTAILVIGILIATMMHKLSVEMAVLLIGALGFPSIGGVKTLPGLASALIQEVQKQLASMPPPPLPPPPTVPELSETSTSFARDSLLKACVKPPAGWRCVRGEHLYGPCAAVKDDDSSP